MVMSDMNITSFSIIITIVTLHRECSGQLSVSCLGSNEVNFGITEYLISFIRSQKIIIKINNFLWIQPICSGLFSNMSVVNYNSYFSLRVFIIERVYFLNKLNIRLDFDRRKRRIDSVEIHVDIGIAVIVQVVNRVELVDLQTVLQHDEVVLDHIVNTCLPLAPDVPM